MARSDLFDEYVRLPGVPGDIADHAQIDEPQVHRADQTVFGDVDGSARVVGTQGEGQQALRGGAAEAEGPPQPLRWPIDQSSSMLKSEMAMTFEPLRQVTCAAPLAKLPAISTSQSRLLLRWRWPVRSGKVNRAVAGISCPARSVGSWWRVCGDRVVSVATAGLVRNGAAVGRGQVVCNQGKRFTALAGGGGEYAVPAQLVGDLRDLLAALVCLPVLGA
jgi:hypothetical protein